MKTNKSLPMNLQIFAEPAPAEPAPQPNPEPTNQPTAPVIDYEKIANIVAGKQAATEDSVLRGYFKQQGLSREEADQAITAFKQQKEASKPNVEALQQQTTVAQQAALTATIERDAYMMSGELGVDNKTMSYILRMADLSSVTDNGKVLQDKLKEALNKVLEEIPQLKPQADVQQSGFRQIGVGNQQQSAPAKATNQNAVPVKRWNRFN